LKDIADTVPLLKVVTAIQKVTMTVTDMYNPAHNIIGVIKIPFSNTNLKCQEIDLSINLSNSTEETGTESSNMS